MATSVPLWFGSDGWAALLSFSRYSFSLSVSNQVLLSFRFAQIVQGSHIFPVSFGVNSPIPLFSLSKRSLGSDQSLLIENLMVDMPPTSSTFLTSSSSMEMLSWTSFSPPVGGGPAELEKIFQVRKFAKIIPRSEKLDNLKWFKIFHMLLGILY